MDISALIPTTNTLKRISILCLFILASCTEKKIDTDNSAADKSAADKNEIRSHIESIFQAFVDQDLQKIRATHTTDWTGLKGSSKKVLRGIDDYMLNIPEGLKGYQMTQYKFEDIEIQVYGDFAVVYYVAMTKFRVKNDPDTTQYPVYYKSADIYRREDDSWIQAGSHITSFDPTEI